MHPPSVDGRPWLEHEYARASSGDTARARETLADLLATGAADDLRPHSLYLDARAAQAAGGWAAAPRASLEPAPSAAPARGGQHSVF